MEDQTTLTEELSTLDMVEALLGEGDVDSVVAVVAELRPADLAYLLEHLSSEGRATLVTSISPEAIGAAMEYAGTRSLGEIVGLLSRQGISDAIAVVADDVATDVVQALDTETAAWVMAALPNRRRRELDHLLGYDEETAGGRMTGQVFTVPPTLTAGQTIERMRVLDPDGKRPFYLYVADEQRRLLGVVNLRALLTSPVDRPVMDLATQDVVSVPAAMDQEEAARLIKRHNLLSLPVVDDDGRLLGAVTSDDLIHVLDEEATEDIYRMVGVSERENLRSVWPSIRNRLPWLTVNLGTVIAAAWVVAQFESTLARVAVLAAFLPVVGGQGGNAGIQTLTVVVRSMALGEIELRDTLSVIWHELRVGLAVGAVTAALVGGLAYAWFGSPWLGFIVGAALAANGMIGVMFGVLIPMGLFRLKQDPALSGGIWLTTFTDICGFAVYLGLATALLTRIS